MFFKRLVIKNFRNFRGVNTICLRTMNVLKTGNKVAAWQLVDALRFVLGYPNAIPFASWEDLSVSGKNETISVSLTYSPQTGQVRNLRRMIRDKVMRYFHNEVEVTLQEYYAVVTSFGLDKPFLFEDELFDIAINEIHGLEEIVYYKHGRPNFASELQELRNAMKRLKKDIQNLLEKNDEAWKQRLNLFAVGQLARQMEENREEEHDEMAPGPSNRPDIVARPVLPAGVPAQQGPIPGPANRPDNVQVPDSSPSPSPEHSPREIDESSDDSDSTVSTIYGHQFSQSNVRVLVSTPSFQLAANLPPSHSAFSLDGPSGNVSSDDHSGISLDDHEENVEEMDIGSDASGDEEMASDTSEESEDASSHSDELPSEDSATALMRSAPQELLEQTAKILPITLGEYDNEVEANCKDQLISIVKEIMWLRRELIRKTYGEHAIQQAQADKAKIAKLISNRKERNDLMHRFLQTQNSRFLYLQNVYDCVALNVLPRFTAHGSLVDHLAMMPQDIWQILCFVLGDLLWTPIVENHVQEQQFLTKITGVRANCAINFLVLDDYRGLKEFLYEDSNGITLTTVDHVQRFLINLKSLGLIQEMPHFLFNMYQEAITEQFLDSIFLENPEISTAISPDGYFWGRTGVKGTVAVYASVKQERCSLSPEELAQQLVNLQSLQKIANAYTQIWNGEITVLRLEESFLERTIQWFPAGVQGEEEPDFQDLPPAYIVMRLGRLTAEVKEIRETLFLLTEARFLSYIEPASIFAPSPVRDLLERIKEKPIDRSGACSRRELFYTETVMSPPPPESREFEFSYMLLPAYEDRIKEMKRQLKERKRRFLQLEETRWNYLAPLVSVFGSEFFTFLEDMLGEEYALVDENCSLRFVKVSTPGQMQPVDLQQQTGFVKAMLVLAAFLALTMTSGPVAIIDGIDNYLPHYARIPGTRSGILQKIFPAMRRALLTIMERCHDSPLDYSKFLKQVILISDDAHMSPTTESVIAVTTDVIFNQDRGAFEEVYSLGSTALERPFLHRFSRQSDP